MYLRATVSTLAFELPPNFRMYMFSSLRLPFGYPLASHFVEEVDDDVVLLDTQAIEVLSYHVGQLVFGLSAELLASCDCRRVEADAPWLGEDPIVVVANEGGRRLEAVGSAICVEDVPFEGGPLKLLERADNN